jgi:predicted transcriptional regulator
MTIKEAVTKILEDHNMSKYRLAKHLGTTQTNIDNWLKNDTQAPHKKYCEKIYKSFGLVVYFTKEELDN